MTPAASYTSYATSTVAMRKEASELRKTLKPLLEKRRRARINDCLERLKSLIVPLMGKDNCRYSKLEKADILELTVRFLSENRKPPTKDASESYREGYEACMQRVSELLPRASLGQDAHSRVQDFIQKSVLSIPACRNCSSRSAKISPVQPKSRASPPKPKALCLSRNESVGSAGAAPVAAPQASTQTPVWRPW